MTGIAGRVLFVAPCTHSSGEAVTALHVARDLRSRGIDCWFVASAGAARLLVPAFDGRVIVLGDSLAANQARWRAAMTDIAPDAIVFADYPLLLFASGAVPLADARWVDSLQAFTGALVTLDHLGYAQRRQAVFFGPPQLTFGAEVTAELPQCMEILLPCPTHEPGPVRGRKGLPVRYWEPPRALPEERVVELRRRYLDDHEGLLMFHSTPSWATRLAAQLGLPHYRFVPTLLQRHLGGVDGPVTVVSVNDGTLPVPALAHGVRFVHLAALAPSEYEALLAAADLVLTDNAVSASLGKAVRTLTPCALLRNTFELAVLMDRAPEDPTAAIAVAIENERPGAIFPYDVFPVWDERALDQLGFGYAESYGRTFARLELFGGEATRAAIAALLFDAATRAALRTAQRDYVTALEALPSAAEAIAARIARGESDSRHDR
jgi:hypothetical protein